MKKVLIISNTIFLCIGIVIGLTILVYANTYSSNEISYDTSTSGAVQANVKDALDFLYNKTKSGVASECPENMSCVEKPGVVMQVEGPGTVDKGTVYVGLNESNAFTVTPNNGYTLHSISCDNGYTIGSFKTLSTEAMSPQEITITNPGTTNGATCNVKFSTNEISISSTNLAWHGGAKCNIENEGCVCYYINKYVEGHNSSTDRGKKFNYDDHTDCVFKEHYCHISGGSKIGCDDMWYNSPNTSWEKSYNMGYGSDVITCSGVITCAT